MVPFTAAPSYTGFIDNEMSYTSIFTMLCGVLNYLFIFSYFEDAISHQKG
jgi:hypothetical protein